MAQNTRKSPSHWIWIIAFSLVSLIWVGNLWILSRHDYDARGTFGDMFGAANALFTGLAFAAVIYGLFVQRYEVKLLTEELQGTKDLAAEQQKLAQVQIEAQEKQQFEATFFNLLRLFNDLVDGISYSDQLHLIVTDGRNRTLGRRVFTEIVNMLPNYDLRYKDAPNEFVAPELLPEALQPSMVERYEKFYEAHPGELGHYFRTLYNLFKFVDQSVLEDDEKRIYTNLIRAQLSDDEAMVLFLNGLTARGAQFKPYLEKYAVLKNVNQKHDIFLCEGRRTEYSVVAFK